MFRKLIASITGGSEPPQLHAFEQARWEELMRTGRGYFDRGKYDMAIRWLSACITPDMPDERRQETSYYLAVANLRDDRYEESDRLFEEVVRLADKLGGQHDLVSTLNLWARSFEMRGEAEAAKPIRARHLEVTAALTDHMWETDEATGDVIHRTIGIRFPPSFRGYRRTGLSFERNDGTSGIVFYEAPAPHRSTVRITLNVTDLGPAVGLHGLSDEAVWWMGGTDASFTYDSFIAGTGPRAPAGVRRRWPITEKDGDNWLLETFFVAFGNLQISFFVAHVINEFDPDDITTLLEDFDWPRADRSPLQPPNRLSIT